MTTLTMELPEDVFSALRRTPGELACELLLAAAIHWYQRGRISQEKAAQIAGLDRTDFLLALAREQVGVFTVDLEDLHNEVGPAAKEPVRIARRGPLTVAVAEDDLPPLTEREVLSIREELRHGRSMS